jgi:hypothetical protein
MADFTPKKGKETSKAAGSLAHDNAEHQSPPHIYLEHHHLEKLGLKHMPKVGSKVKISGLAHVGATSEHDRAKEPGEKGGKHRSMTLHLHKMDIGKEGISEGEKEESQKAGMKGAMDKALKRAAGGDGPESEGEEA